MSDKRAVIWSPAARAELRSIHREAALRILNAVDHYLTTGAGDVVRLRPPRFEFRLRVGDYRVIFLRTDPNRTEILHVRHRSEAYR